MFLAFLLEAYSQSRYGQSKNVALVMRSVMTEQVAMARIA